ncbi:MAG: hypothetical protein V4671_04210 [Armatimonadota bacterium]
MDDQTAETFEEARRQLFDPTVEDQDILIAKASIKRAEEMRAQARATITDPMELLRREKALNDQIESQRNWILTLREIQEQKIQRQEEIREIAE